MEDEKENQSTDDSPAIEPIKKSYALPASILISALIIIGIWIYATGLKYPQNQARLLSQVKNQAAANTLEEKVLPPDGIILPVRWGNLGAEMVNAGVIDGEKLEQLYVNRGGLDEETRNLLYGENNGYFKITPENSGMILNLLWALGLGAKNDILETGPMSDPKYGGAGNFASTGGWTLAKGDAMDHYSRHQFIILTPEQQKLVERASKNIYRPCCGNSTHFPDCNHGMAMLGLLELMASQNASEKEMYKAALQVNAYWFPDTCLTIAQYLESKGIEWGKADPQELLGANYSSGSGYRQILSQVTAPAQKSGGSCGI